MTNFNGGPSTNHTAAFFDIEKAGPYFTGTGPIKFSEMRQYFKEVFPIDNTIPISASELRRNVDVLERNPIVPDSTENENIASVNERLSIEESDWKCSQLRGSVKRYYATTNTSTIPQLSMGRFSGSNGVDWSNSGTQGVDSINQLNGNVARNIEKHIFIKDVIYSGDMGTDGNRGSGGNGKDKIAAARLIPSEPNNAVVPAHNVRITVEDTGAIYGSAGLGGYHSTGGFDDGSGSGLTKNWFAISNPQLSAATAALWTQFMLNYAVYPSAPSNFATTDPYVGSAQTGRAVLDVPAGGIASITIEMACDNAGTFTLLDPNGSTLTTQSFSTQAGNPTITPSTTVTLTNITQGEHIITFTITNSSNAGANTWAENPAGIAWQIRDTNTNVDLLNSRSVTGGVGVPKKSDPGKDGGVALKIVHTGSQTDIILKENARVWGGGGGGEQGTMGELVGSSMEDMRHDCVRNYFRDGGCGSDPVCDAGDTLVPGSVEETGFCGSGTQRTTTGICQNIVKSTIPVQGIGGQGGDGAGWRYTAPYVGGAPQEETLGQDGSDNACGVCPPGTNLQGGNCSSVGGRGGDGGNWGEGGGSTLPLESGEPHDAGKGGSAICGLNPDTNQKNWVVSGTISDQTLKGEYQLGGCDGTAGDQPPVPSPAIVTVSKPHYVRFGDAAGDGTDGYGADGAANLLVTAPPDSAFGSIMNFRIKYSWLDREDRAGTHMTGMEVGGKRFGLPSGTWYIAANNPVGGAAKTAWSQFMQKYAIFPGDSNYFTGARAYVRLFDRYPIQTLTDEVHQLRYRFTIPTNNNNIGFRLYAQSDNHASFSIGRVGETTSQLGEVAEFSNPGEGGDVLDVTYSGTDLRFQPGEYYLDVTIKNSSFPVGQEPAPGANTNWFFNPGGVAFVLLNLQRDNFNDLLNQDFDESETDDYPNYMVTSRNLNSINYYTEGSMEHEFNLPQGAYPITWTGLNGRNVVPGRNYPKADRMQFNQGKEIQLLDDTDMDANGRFQILTTITNQDPTIGPRNAYMAYIIGAKIIRVNETPDVNESGLGYMDSTDVRAYFYPISQAIAEEYLSGRFGRSGTYPNRGRPPDVGGLEGRVLLYLNLGGSLSDNPVNPTIFAQVKADIAQKYVSVPGSTPEANRGNVIGIEYPTVDTIYPGATMNWSTDAENTLTATSTPNDPTFNFSGNPGSDGDIQPMASTRYRFIAIGPGGTDIEDRNIM